MLYTAKHTGDEVLVVRDEFLPLVERVKDLLPKSLKLFLITSDTSKTVETKLEPAYNYEHLVEKASSNYEFPDLDENTDATLFYTSGTTRLPKGVIFTRRQIVLHTFFVVMASAFSFVLPGRYEWDYIPELMRKEKVTYTYGVPTILHALVNRPKAEEYRDVFSRPFSFVESMDKTRTSKIDVMKLIKKYKNLKLE